MTSLPTHQVEALVASAKSHFDQGIAYYEQHNLASAINSWRSALSDYQTLIDAGHNQYRANAAKARNNLAAALSKNGQLPEALEAYRQALLEYQTLIDAGHNQYRANAAHARNNLAIALSDNGQLSEALQAYRQALLEYQTLIDAGHNQYRANAAHARNNLAIALSDNGQLPEALEVYRQALLEYQTLIDDGHHQYRADAAHARNNLANALSKNGQLPEALQAYRQALLEFQTLIDDGHHQYRADAAHARNNLATALSDNGQLPEALQEHRQALLDYQNLIDAGHNQYRADAAHARNNLANALSKNGQLPEALEVYRQALLEYQTLIDDGHNQYRADAAKARNNLAAALSKNGQLPEALGAYRQALLEYQTMIDAGHNQYRANAAHARNNLAAALSENGQLPEALGAYRQALLEYQTLIDAGHNQYRANAAHARNNLANALSNNGQLPEALQAYRQALLEYQTLIDDGHNQYRADAAHARNNLATALSKNGQLPEALQAYRQALLEFQTLIDAGHNQYRADAAKARNNLAIALSNNDQLSEALQAYRQTLLEYQTLIDDGHNQYRANTAHARSNLADALSDNVQLPAALQEYRQAMDIYVILIQGGQQQHALHANQVANQLARLAITLQTNESVTSMDKDKAQTELGQALKVLGEIKTIQTTDAQRLQELRNTLDTCEKYWSMREEHQASYPGLTSEVVTVCATWLEQAADLLAHGHPFYLNEQYKTRIKPMLNVVLAFLLKNGRAEPIAMWHLRTQGLRAQRQAIAAGMAHDPELAKLDRMYNQIERLDREFLGAGLMQNQPVMLSLRDDNQRHTNGTGLGGSVHQGQGMPSNLAQRDRLWAELQRLENQLQLAGKLPDTKRLDLRHLGECLVAMQASRKTHQAGTAALLLLIPKDDTSLVIVCVQAADTMGGTRLPYQAFWREETMTMSEAALRDSLDRLTQEIANDGRSVRGGSCRVADQADAAKPVPKAMTQAELATLRSDWLHSTDVLRPLLADLREQGVTEVHVVPGGDLHLAPWAANLNEPDTGLRVRQFPTTASWWRVMKEDASEPVAASRWASLAFDATNTNKPALTWVGVEARALQQIWEAVQGVTQPPVQPLNPEKPHWPPTEQTSAPAVHGLVGMGHGGAQEGNWAMAGLFTGTEPASPGSKELCDRYFTGLNLSGIKEVRHLVMSCCVLGRLKDSQGEPIGLTALAFAFKARMAVGAMVPIPDLEGALFSMALHFAWATAEKTALADGQAVDWSVVFHATRREVMTGQWPDGFGGWLTENLMTLATTLNDDLDARRSCQLEEIAPGYNVEAWIETLGRAPTSELGTVATMFTCLG